MTWRGVKVLVTGGASFIGSHLVDTLVKHGAKVAVVDNLSSGRLENLHPHLETGDIAFVEADLARQDAAESAVSGQSCVFHLAADHGGRGYIDTHEANCAANLTLDGLVFRACVESGVERIVYASSGCVYPKDLQADPNKIVNLEESQVGPPYNADGIYGWGKLMGEKVLAAYAREHGIQAVSCRYFTAYGPRANESHAVMAMIARAFIRENPFVVWGTGEQIRNWTHVSDIVAGTLKAASIPAHGEAVNIGTMEATRVLDAAKMILQRSGHDVPIVTRPDLPTGPYYRIADNAKLFERTGWHPQVTFAQGLAQTMDWYYATKSASDIEKRLPELLFER
jgi:nucleoside-diphosphate-sugar epimerase